MDTEGDNQQEQTTTTKAQLACTRTLDNHYDPKVHEKPWIAAGCLRDYKYEYSDSGLGFIMNKQLKMKSFKERHEQIKEVEELNRKSKGFRHFREYDNVCNNEIVITIEYCTNCKQHQGSTRHDEEKYAHFANTLKREIVMQYPIVKVILKPLIFEQNDQSTEALYLRARLGAFEVQLFAKDSKGELTKKYVFSKLRTRAWPNVSNVIEDISSFLPASDFAVQLVDPNYDSEEIKEENESERHTSSQRRVQANRLKGMYVVLRPVRNTKKSSFGLTETNSNVKGYGESSRLNLTTSSRPASAMVRPQSGMSTASNKSKLSAKKNSSGGENQSTASSGLKEYVEQTDGYGVVLFKKIPHNLYEIEVLETHNYLPEKRVVNVFEMVERGDPLKEHILLKEQTMGFCRLKLVENYMPFTDASIIVAKRNPDPNSKTAVLREKDPKSGVYEFMIDPGAYIISISKAGFGERKEELIANRGVNDFVVDLGKPSGYNPSHHTHQGHQGHHQHAGNQNYSDSQANQPHQYNQNYQNSQKQVEPAIIAERPNTGSRQRPTSSKGRHEPQGISAKPASKDNVAAPLQSDVTQKQKPQETRAEKPHDIASHEEGKPKERVKSALVKKAEFCVLDIDTGKPIVGTSVILEEIGFKGTTNEQGKCLVPISKVNCGKLILDHEDYFGMVEEYGDEDVEFKNTSEKKFNLIPRPNDIHEVQMRFLPGSGVRCAKFSVLYDKDDHESKKDIVVHHGEGGREIIILKNLLKKHGVFRIIAEVSNLDEFMNDGSMFILSHYADCDQLYIFPPTEDLYEGQKIFWDAGFFSNPVVNPQFVEINGYSNKEISLYSSLKEYQMLLNYLHNSKSDMKTVLGFKDKRRIEKDNDVFIPREAIYASLDKYGLEIKNLDHLLASACTPEGLYSFRECERRFASLRPPFNFVKGHGQKDLSSEGEGEDGSGEGDEEYLFEDDQP